MPSTTEPKTMKAVVLKKAFEIVTEERPVPTVEDDTDVVVKVSMSALCGSDLHMYRGHQPLPSWDYIMGHELVGTITSVGSAVKKFKVGDRVVSPFTIHCGDCFQCQRGLTSRCAQSKLFGSPVLDGGQAEYARVPIADSTLIHAPNDVSDDNLILLCDILPTGYYCAQNAWDLLNDHERKNPTTAVVLGCGPVGLCAITAATERFTKVVAIDSVPERLEQAKEHGAAETINLTSGEEAILKRLRDLTDGRGPDVALELVGHPPALQLAMKAVRVGGVIASQGVHTHKIEMDGPTLYNKNLRLQFGRCPVGHVLPQALELLRRQTKSRPGLFEKFIKRRAKLDDARQCYEDFEKQKVGKVVFVTA